MLLASTDNRGVAENILANSTDGDEGCQRRQAKLCVFPPRTAGSIEHTFSRTMSLNILHNSVDKLDASDDFSAVESGSKNDSNHLSPHTLGLAPSTTTWHVDLKTISPTKQATKSGFNCFC